MEIIHKSHKGSKVIKLTPYIYEWAVIGVN